MATYHLTDPHVSLMLLAAGAVAAVGYVAYRVWEKMNPELNPQFPVVAVPDSKDFRQALLEGYRKYPDTPFVIPETQKRLFLPMKYLHEISHAPEDEISFNKMVYETFAGKYTAAGTKRDEVIMSVRGDLTKSIGSILPMVQEEARYGLEKEIGHPEEWKTVELYNTLARIVALLSGRIFVGLPLSRDEEWLKMSVDYTMDLAAISRQFTTMNNFIRPFVEPFAATVLKARRDLKRAQEWMAPLVREAILHSHDHEKSAPVKAGTCGTFISWMLGHLPENLRNAKRISENQMIITFAAIHTTTMTSTNVLCDLASRPEYIEPLRAEFEQVLRETDGAEGIDEQGRPYISKMAISRMHKLDSFIKESQRLSPLGFASVGRRVIKATTLSDGLHLPKGTRIAFPMWGVYQSEAFGDGSNGNPGPEVFDGFRFARMREQPGEHAKHQTVTTSADSLNFGHGSHACPGRFFAMYEIKTMVLEFLQEYDFRMAGDVDGLGGEKWWPRVSLNQLAALPNTEVRLEVRKRRV